MAQPSRAETIGAIMTRDVSCCPPDATLQQVAKLMADRNVGTVPIAEGDRLVGLVTDRDLAVRAIAAGADPRTERIAPYVTKSVTTVRPDTPIDQAVRLMEEHQIRRLPVVEGGRLVGIVSLGDLATKATRPTGQREQMAGEALEEISKPSRPQ